MVIETAVLTLTNIEGNNNKFWKYSINDNNDVVFEWGRIGYAGDSTTKKFPSLDKAQSAAHSKMRSKEAKGYVKQDVIESGKSVTVSPNTTLESVAVSQIAKNSSIVETLIKQLAKLNVHEILLSTTMTYNVDTGLFSTPIGIVSSNSITEARKLLISMSDYILKGKFDNLKYHKMLQQYLTYIPQNVGMRLKADTLYTSNDDILKQNSILDSLEASLLMVNSQVANVNKTDEVATPQIFTVSLEHVEDKKIIDRITKKFKSTLNRSHSSSSYKLLRVYSVEIPEAKTRFLPVAKNLGNVEEYWHGTQISNVLSILKQGLVIPRSNAAHVCGRMFGDGLYFSDQSTKALNYATGFWHRGKGQGNNCFMFLADVAMGKAYVPARASSDLPKKGYDSTHAIGGKSGVQNNEMIVYNVNQANPTYLVEFERD
jgi:poly [ADP-ribose] polymerase